MKTTWITLGASKRLCSLHGRLAKQAEWKAQDTLVRQPARATSTAVSKNFPAISNQPASVVKTRMVCNLHSSCQLIFQPPSSHSSNVTSMLGAMVPSTVRQRNWAQLGLSNPRHLGYARLLQGGMVIPVVQSKPADSSRLLLHAHRGSAREILAPSPAAAPAGNPLQFRILAVAGLRPQCLSNNRIWNPTSGSTHRQLNSMSSSDSSSSTTTSSDKEHADALPPPNDWWASRTIALIVGVNVFIFLLWQITKLRRFMAKNFAISTHGVTKELRLHTVLTSIFSHYDPVHLATNMLTLSFFGAEAVTLLGASRFLQLFMLGGLVSSMCQVAWPAIARHLSLPSKYVVSPYQLGLGASGAINAVVAYSIFTFPHRIVLFMFVLPVPAALLGALFLAKDVSGLYYGDSSYGNAAHLGGSLFGFLFWLRFRVKQNLWHI